MLFNCDAIFAAVGFVSLCFMTQLLNKALSHCVCSSLYSEGEALTGDGEQSAARTVFLGCLL